MSEKEDFNKLLRDNIINSTGLPAELIAMPNLNNINKVCEAITRQSEKTCIFGNHLLEEKKQPKRIFILRDNESKEIEIVMRIDPMDERPAYIDFLLTTVEYQGECSKLMPNGEFEKVNTGIEEKLLARSSIKFDGCSHWNFDGEDSLNKKADECGDAYYHLCGFQCYERMILGLLFAWKVAGTLIDGFMDRLEDNDDSHSKLYGKLLEDYTIEEITDGSIGQEPTEYVNY